MKRALVICAAVVFLGGCADTHDAATPRSFADGVCSAIAVWGDEIVARANQFTDDSSHLSVDGRRTRYLFAFDDQRRLTDELRERIASAPAIEAPADIESIRSALLHAVDDVVANIDDQKADAATSVDFHFLGPKPDRLFAGTEKSLSLMLKPLDEVAATEQAPELGGSCGRPQD